jgi:hypothetical protein
MTKAEQRARALAAYDLDMTAASYAMLHADKPAAIVERIQAFHAATCAAWADYITAINKLEAKNEAIEEIR